MTLSDGTKARLDSAGYAKYRALPKREDRVLVFREFWKSYKAFERTFGVALDAQARRDLFYARARKYPSSLAAAVDAAHVPEAVYRTLVAEANHALPTLHRAFRLRGKLLGIPDLGYHDIYAPLVASVDLKFPIEQGQGPDPGRARAPGRRLRGHRAHGLRVALDGRLSPAREALGRLLQRLRLRRPPLRPPELQRRLRRRLDPGPRVRPRHALVPGQQGPALPHRRLPHLRGRGRVHLQRGAPAPEDAGRGQDRRRAPLPPGLVAREHAGDVLPPGDVRGVRARHPRDGREGRSPDRREALEDVPRAAAPLPRRRQGRREDRRGLRCGVGLHPPLLLQLLRLPVRHVARRLRPPRPRRDRRQARAPGTATSACCGPAARAIPTTC